MASNVFVLCGLSVPEIKAVFIFRIMNMMEMKQIQRHFFNPNQAVLVRPYKLEVWPGFIMSIHKYETSVLLCMELSHKILRTDTVLDQLYDIYDQSQQKRQSFQDLARKDLLGQIVLTR